MMNENTQLVHGDGIYQITALTQDAYDTLLTPDSRTVYMVMRDENRGDAS